MKNFIDTKTLDRLISLFIAIPAEGKKEIKALKDAYGINLFDFVDDKKAFEKAFYDVIIKEMKSKDDATAIELKYYEANLHTNNDQKDAINHMIYMNFIKKYAVTNHMTLVKFIEKGLEYVKNLKYQYNTIFGQYRLTDDMKGRITPFHILALYSDKELKEHFDNYRLDKDKAAMKEAQKLSELFTELNKLNEIYNMERVNIQALYAEYMGAGKMIEPVYNLLSIDKRIK